MQLPTVRLEIFEDAIDEVDPDANFKRDVALYSRIDPMPTLEGMSRNLNLPVGVIARYVLVKWATSGSEGAMELGPRVVGQMASIVAEAEESGEDGARLEAYEKLSRMVSWLGTIYEGGWEGGERTSELLVRRVKKEKTLKMDRCGTMKDSGEEPFVEEGNLDDSGRELELESLLERITPENLHPEWETGPPQGKEF